MTKRRDGKLKLPDDFLGTVKALLSTPPLGKTKRKQAKRKARTSAKTQRK